MSIMKDNSLMDDFMGMDYLSTDIRTFIRESGLKESQREWANRNGGMEHIIKANLGGELKRDREYLNGLMEVGIKDSSIII